MQIARSNCSSYLFGLPVALSDVVAILEPLENLLYRGLLGKHLLHLQAATAGAGLLLLSLESLLGELNVLQPQLLADDVQVTGGVYVTLDVDDLGVIEASNHLEDGVDGADVRQEGIAETSTGRGTAGQTGNVVHGQVGGNLGLGLVLLAEPVEAVIGDDDARLLGVDGGIGEVCRVTEVAFCDGLEERGLADVGEADLDAECG